MRRPTATPEHEPDISFTVLFHRPNPLLVPNLTTTIPSTLMVHVISHASSFSVSSYTPYFHSCPMSYDCAICNVRCPFIPLFHYRLKS